MTKSKKKSRKKRFTISATVVIAGLAVLAVALIAGGLWYNQAYAQPRQFTIVTERGDIVVEVYPGLMPKTVTNFQKLVNRKFYDGLTFHRVEEWVIQGGDPAGDGTGGPGWSIKLEVNPELLNTRGALAMARSAHPDSAGSQFYILKEDAEWLDGGYAVFGRVISGMELVDQLEEGDRMLTVRRASSSGK